MTFDEKRKALASLACKLELPCVIIAIDETTHRFVPATVGIMHREASELCAAAVKPLYDGPTRAVPVEEAS